ncbi:hypothetical protein LX36DRAFT_390549 [Colletotrichum falcatum]|nr:hypothetical protein LX36DRAFT_390549 [Colletotrichum falcatum]
MLNTRGLVKIARGPLCSARGGHPVLPGQMGDVQNMNPFSSSFGHGDPEPVEGHVTNDSFPEDVTFHHCLHGIFRPNSSASSRFARRSTCLLTGRSTSMETNSPLLALGTDAGIKRPFGGRPAGCTGRTKPTVTSSGAAAVPTQGWRHTHYRRDSFLQHLCRTDILHKRARRPRIVMLVHRAECTRPLAKVSGRPSRSIQQLLASWNKTASWLVGRVLLLSLTGKPLAGPTESRPPPASGERRMTCLAICHLSAGAWVSSDRRPRIDIVCSG